MAALCASHPAWTTFYGKIHKKPLSYYIELLFIANPETDNARRPIRTSFWL